jgi:hypothetical protein
MTSEQRVEKYAQETVMLAPEILLKLQHPRGYLKSRIRRYPLDAETRDENAETHDPAN